MAWPDSVRKTDLKIEYYRGSGPGGQHRNKTSTACRITHIPTGISAYSTDSKFQSSNKQSAFRKLAQQLVPLMIPKIPEANRSNKRVRTYNFSRNEVIDDRLDKIFNIHKVLDGDLDPIINKLLQNENTVSKK